MSAPNPLQQFLRVQQKMDATLRRLLVEAAIDAARKIYALASKPGVGARTREAQLGMFLQYLKEEQTELWVNTIQPLIERYLPQSAEVAESAVEYLDQVLKTAVGERQAEFLLEGIKVQARIAQSFDLDARVKRLSSKVWKNVDVNTTRIQRKVQKHLLTGTVNPRELAAEVRRFIDPSTPGGASYAAMRLARTEINAAFHDRQRQIAKERPWVESAKWNLSRTHKIKCQCDVIARGHGKGMKRGHYPADDIPDKPHPHCLCYVTYDLMNERDMTNLLRAELGKALLIA